MSHLHLERQSAVSQSSDDGVCSMAKHVLLDRVSRRIQRSSGLYRSKGFAMRRKLRQWLKLVGSLVIIASSPAATAQITNNVGTSGFQFLKIEVGARENALGDAGTAVATGPEALFWNVAGITAADRPAAMFFYNPWIASISQDYFAVTLPVGGDNYLGLSGNFVSLGQMEQTTVDQPQGTGITFSAGDFAVGVSYARQISNWVSAGITVKYVNETIWNLVSGGLDFDLGLAYNSGRWHMGMIIKDFGPSDEISGSELQTPQQIYPSWQTSNVLVSLVPKRISLPTSFSVGAGYDIMKNDFNRITLLGNLAYFNDIGQTFNGAAEYTFLKMFSLRVGYKFDTDIYGMTFGAGIRAPIDGTTLGVDFAAMQVKYFGYRTQFDVSFSF